MSIPFETARRWADQWCVEHPESSQAAIYRAYEKELARVNKALAGREEEVIKLRKRHWTQRGRTGS